MPGATENFEVPYAEGADAPPSVPTITKSMADRLEELFGAVDLSQLVTGGEPDNGKLVIVNSGAAAYKAMSGDGTIDQDGNFQLGAGVVGSSELASKAVTTAKIDSSAVTEAKINDGDVTSRKAALTAGVVSASSNLTLTTSYQDVPGTTLELTPAVTSLLKVTAVFDISELGDPGSVYGTIRLDAEDQTPPAVLSIGSATVAGTMPQVYLLSLSAATHTVKMRARRVSGSGGKILSAEGKTRFLYELIAA